MQEATRIIETMDDISEGVAALVRACPHMAHVHEVAGLPPLRRREAGFTGLARIVVGQQLSVASAGAIWGRLEQRVTPFGPDALLRKRDATLRACGLSAGKAATLRAAARAIAREGFDLDGLGRGDPESLREGLLAIRGIGPWTADIYMMFCLGHADAWAPGDLALKYAIQDAARLRKLPDEKRMNALARRWRPWRGVAARMLWAYYAARKQPRSGVPV